MLRALRSSNAAKAARRWTLAPWRVARRTHSTAAAAAAAVADAPVSLSAPAVLHTSAHNAAAVKALREWVSHSRVLTVISGAGISTASGIPDYRSPGRPPHRPVQHTQFMTSHAVRQRYWLRSALGFPKLFGAQPNAAHVAVAQAMARAPVVAGSGSGAAGNSVSYLVTQNVDGLHTKAGAPDDRVLPLHGDIRAVQCMTCHTVTSRSDLQARLIELNAELLAPYLRADAVSAAATAAAAEAEADSTAERAPRPDGDAFLSDATIQALAPRMRVPACSRCADASGGALPHVHEPVDPRSAAAAVPDPVVDFSRVRATSANPSPRERAEADAAASVAALVRRGDRPGILKPHVIFFGGSVPAASTDRAKHWIAQSDSVLCVGTSLAVFSAYRLVLQALDQLPAASVPDTPDALALRGLRRVCVLNDGPTRADDLLSGPNGAALHGRVTKIAARAEHVLPQVFA